MISLLGPSVLKISLGSNVMTTTIMSRFSYVSASILFLLGVFNIIFAWKTHSYLYTADIKRREHTTMGLDRRPSPSISSATPIENEKKKPIEIYLLIKE